MNLASLPVRIEARRGSAVPEFREGRWVFAGEVQWCFRGEAHLLAELHTAFGAVSERLSPELLLVDFGNAVGFLHLPVLGVVEVVSGKWDHRHFEWMLQDLMKVASALPFSADTATALPYDRSVATHDHLLYHAFVYLRHILSERASPSDQLLPALHAILRDPHRRFEREVQSVPLETATRVDPLGLLTVVSRPDQLYPVRSDVRDRISLADALDGRLPKKLWQSQVRSTFDTAENRFVKSVLQLALGIIEGMRQAVSRRRDTAFTRQILRDCQWMERTLFPIQRHSLWDGVGPMVHLPAGSTVLQRRTGYREVFMHFNHLRLASRVPLNSETVWKLLEAKDIATLYELWCFFSVARALEGLLGPPYQAEGVRTDALQATLPWEFHLRWKNNTRLFYNPRFSRSAGALRRSYSVPLRPDIGLQLPSNEFHLFDAKFRLDALDSVFSSLTDTSTDAEVAAELELERRGTFKRDDLYKMHTYRDCVPHARSVWVLYPGSEMRFYSIQSSLVQESAKLATGGWDGVGAIPLRPSETSDSIVSSVLQHLLTTQGPTDLA